MEEAQQLIDSGEVGTMSIIVDKKPFLDALNAQMNSEESNHHDIIEEEGVPVVEALSVIFGIPLEPHNSESLAWSKDG